MAVVFPKVTSRGVHRGGRVLKKDGVFVGEFT